MLTFDCALPQEPGNPLSTLPHQTIVQRGAPILFMSLADKFRRIRSFKWHTCYVTSSTKGLSSI